MSRPTYDVLVAEPDAAQGQIVDMLLADPSYDVTIVTSGREVLARLKTSTPDACLLALDLPDVSGDDICSKIRRVTRLSNVPVVLIAPQSGRFGLSDDARRRARKASADLVLPRPLGDKNLRDRIRALIEAREETTVDDGASTRLIDEALAEIDELPEGGGPFPPAGEPSRRAVPEATPAASDDDGDEARAELAQLRKEREILEVENAQLKRKLREKQQLIERGENPKLEKRVEELERRNAALLERLQELEGDSDDDRSGGFFGRRK